MVEIIRWTCFVMVIGLALVIGSIMVTSAQDPMIISIDSPSDGETVNTNRITVSGSATVIGEQYIDSVTVNDVQAGRDTWSADITLTEGGNDITVVATTDMRQSSSETITVIYNPPTPHIQPPRYDGAPSVIPTPTPTLTGSISITTSPPGAEVYLDDSFAGNTTITLTLETVTEGHHKVKVSKEGYRSETRKIYLYTGKTSELNIELKPITGSIVVYSTPSGASVYLDDVDMNKITPYVLSEVLIGQHSIKLTKSDYFDLISNVSVSDSRTTYLLLNLTGCGYITISSDPSGANVHLDGDCKGETPKNIGKVVVGNHTIKLTKADYDDVIRNVSLSVGETLTLHENLTGYGSLCISSAPYNASVYVDDVYVGETPLLIRKVVVGWHSCRLTKTGYEDVAKMIQVSAGIVTDVDESFSSGLPPSLEYKLVIAVGIIGILSLIVAVLFEYRKKILNWINVRLERRRRNR